MIGHADSTTPPRRVEPYDALRKHNEYRSRVSQLFGDKRQQGMRRVALFRRADSLRKRGRAG
jgi:hypothetical protein